MKAFSKASWTTFYQSKYWKINFSYCLVFRTARKEMPLWLLQNCVKKCKQFVTNNLLIQCKGIQESRITHFCKLNRWESPGVYNTCCISSTQFPFWWKVQFGITKIIEFRQKEGKVPKELWGRKGEGKHSRSSKGRSLENRNKQNAWRPTYWKNSLLFL